MAQLWSVRPHDTLMRRTTIIILLLPVFALFGFLFVAERSGDDLGLPHWIIWMAAALACLFWFLAFGCIVVGPLLARAAQRKRFEKDCRDEKPVA